MKSVIIEFSGPDQVIDAALDSFSRAHGRSTDSTESPLDFSRRIIRQFIIDSISTHNIRTAQEIAGAAAAAQTQTAIGAATMTATIE